MNLVYITSINKPSGAGTHAKIAMHQLNEAADIDVTAMQGQQTGYPETFRHTETPVPWVFPHNVEEALIELDPDVVIVHLFNTRLYRILRQVKAESDVDAVWILRNGTNLAEQWLTRPYQPRELASAATLVAHLDWFDAIMCPSKAMVEKIRLYYGDDSPELLYIPNPINLKRYVPTTFMQDGTLKILTASRLVPTNFVAAPLIAMRRLHSEIDCQMTILGGGEDSLMNELVELRGDMDAVEMPGQVDRDTAITYMEHADVVCVPSFSQSAVPYAALEAMAAGNVVLTGSYPVAYEEEALIRLPVGHPPRWYEAIKDAHDDPEDASEWVRKGLTAALDYDAQQVIHEALVPALRRLVDGAHGHHD